MNINQDHSCVIIFKDSKFYVYSIDPFKLISTTDIGYEIQNVEMLLKTNFLGIVGKKTSKQFTLWDDYSKKPFAQIRITNPILSVKIRIDTIVLVCECRTYVYDFLSLDRLESIETIENSKGLGLLCQHSCNKLLITLGLLEGEIKLNNLNNNNFDHRSIIIKAHQSKIECIAMNFEGTLLATSSSLGTIIRIFDCQSKTQLHELRRGFDCATITSMAFYETSEWFAVCSTLLTIHIFHLHDGNESKNQKSSFAIFKSYLPKALDCFISREWSYQQFRVPNQPYLLLFNTNFYIGVLTENGHYYKVRFDPIHKEEEPLQLEHQLITSLLK